VEGADLVLRGTESSLEVGQERGAALNVGQGVAVGDSDRAQLLAEGGDALLGSHDATPMQRASSCPANNSLPVA
jgi:hypothetical protein